MEDSATDNQVQSLAIDDIAQIDVEGTTMCSSTNATGEMAIERQSQAAIPTDEQGIRDDSKIQNMERKLSENDSKQMVLEPKENGSEKNIADNVEIEKLDDKCNSPLSTKRIGNEEFSNKRLAKRFRVLSSNKSHRGGKVNKIFFGTVGNPIPGRDSWKILYDDGDVDVFSRATILDAMKYYDVNKDYDKIFGKTDANGEKGGNNTATKATATVATAIRKASPPIKKKARAKNARKEAVPVWTGPPDEEISGGWPKGVSSNCVVTFLVNGCFFQH